jgi:hypothetical protein
VEVDAARDGLERAECIGKVVGARWLDSNCLDAVMRAPVRDATGVDPYASGRADATPQVLNPKAFKTRPRRCEIETVEAVLEDSVHAVRAHVRHRPAGPLQEEGLEVHAGHLGHGVGDDVREPGTSSPTGVPDRDATGRARIRVGSNPGRGPLAGGWWAKGGFTGST